MADTTVSTGFGYNSFGVIDSSIPSLSTIQNTVTQSVSPTALQSGSINGTIQSPGFVSGSSGWQIRPDGSAEFNNLVFRGNFIGATIAGSTITGGTVTGAVFSTNASLPASGDGIVIDNTNGFVVYNSGNPVLEINTNTISFNTPLGISCAEFFTISTNLFQIAIAGSGQSYDFDTAYFGPTAGTGNPDLGGSSNRWGTVFATNGTINTSDIRIKSNVIPLDYGLNEIMRLEPIRYTMDGRDNRLGLSAQAVNKVIPEATSNCEETSMIGTAGLCPTDLIPVLINAIKELKAEVDDLKRSVLIK